MQLQPAVPRGGCGYLDGLGAFGLNHGLQGLLGVLLGQHFDALYMLLVAQFVQAAAECAVCPVTAQGRDQADIQLVFDGLGGLVDHISE